MFDTLIPFIGAVLLLLILPGPDMAVLIANGLRYSARGAFFTSVGVSIGGMVWAIFVALLVASSALHPKILTGIQLCGAAYLLWLAYTVIVAPYSDIEVETQPAKGNLILNGIVTNLANPKAAVFFSAFIPQFIPTAAIQPSLWALGLGTLLCSFGLFVNTAIGFIGTSFSFLNDRGPLNRAWSQWILSGVFLSVSVVFLYNNLVSGGVLITFIQQK